MHPAVTAAGPGTCPECGMKLVPSDAAPAPPSEPGQGVAHSHDHGDGLEWEDLMPEINRASDSGNMIWQLIDRQTGAKNADIDWAFTVGDRVKIRLEYRNRAAMPPGRVLVVGAANSGCQIAEELAATHRVELAAGQRMPVVPQRPLGRDVWWWASMLGLDRVTVGSRLGRRLAGRDQVIGGGPRQLARRHGVGIRPRATGAAGRTVRFADGGAAEFDAVVWATGFTTDHSWIDVPGVHDERGRILHQRGVTPSPGLYLLGLTWQHTRTSALLGWVRNDAAFLAERIASRAHDRANTGPADAGLSHAAAGHDDGRGHTRNPLT